MHARNGKDLLRVVLAYYELIQVLHQLNIML